MGIFAFFLAFATPFLLNFEFNNFEYKVNLSFLSLRESSTIKSEENDYYAKYNITEGIPRLFPNIHPLELNPIEEATNSHLFKYSNTSFALDCYQKLPQYSIIIGLIKEYSYFLSAYYRLRCENRNEYHDGTKCGDIPYLIDLLDNKAEILNEKKIQKKNRCFTIESNIVSVQSRYYDHDGFIGRIKPILESEFILVEKSFLRRLISEFEQTLINKVISYELYCISKLEYKGKGTIDCYRLRLESWILEQELVLISEEYFKRMSRFERLKDIV
ncbi:uncharacterized protein cubi_02134 [Cryptosporidium ubiquitum]|uniref:Uncharacterized protein n=1 Tax=Cryptosporidium ubiquitum TaxID=857276 RepID=A0A1J4MBS0_9CRYT|nr:uncharacterized protein cubi_02134 [Cryptosporidium ubiquitum]OII70923.1 hypothetical protein cubi_02134 [Cryptosporidium ubiquitum]